MTAQTLSKIAIVKDADEGLDRMHTEINEGFSAGRVTKVDLASWIVQYFESQCFEKCRERIQKDHFDNVAYLESVVEQLRKARKEGTAADIGALLLPLTGQVKLNAQKRKGVCEDNEEQNQGNSD
jgi:hypothetical protein